LQTLTLQTLTLQTQTLPPLLARAPS
jgi:hypothetical protein